jgi:hypothetical protein
VQLNAVQLYLSDNLKDFLTSINSKMNKVLASFLFIIWFLGCKENTPQELIDKCIPQVNAVYKAAYFFAKEVDDTANNRRLTKDIYLNEVVGSWKFVCSKELLPKQYCYSFYPADSVKDIMLNFNPDFTYTYTNKDTAHFPPPKKMSGKGKLDSLFTSFYPNSDLDLRLNAPKGNKMFMAFYPLSYQKSYFKKL